MRPTLLHHPKFRRLCAILQLPRPHVIGMLELLWNTAYESGDPEIGDALDVELACDWTGEDGELAAALCDCGKGRGIGFLERTEGGLFLVHDLYDHAPDYVIKRAKREAERKEKGVTISELRAAAGRKSAAARQQASDKQSTNGGHLLPDSDKRSTNGRTPAPAPTPTPKKNLYKKNERTTKDQVEETSKVDLDLQPLDEALQWLPNPEDQLLAKFVVTAWPDCNVKDAIAWVEQAKAYLSQLNEKPLEWIERIVLLRSPNDPVYDRNGRNKLHQFLMNCLQRTIQKQKDEATESMGKTERELEKLRRSTNECKNHAGHREAGVCEDDSCLRRW